MSTELTDDQIIAAIQAARGILSAAARELGMSRQGLYKRLRHSAALLEALEHERESLVDLAEQKLIEALESGERWAIALTLTRLGRHRGWSDAGGAFKATPEERVVKAIDQARYDDLTAMLSNVTPRRR